MINNQDYLKTREERINYLKSLGLDEKEFIKFIPKVYKPINDYIWLDLIKKVILVLEKNESILLKSGYKNFAINGNTENKECYLWQMYNKDRYF